MAMSKEERKAKARAYYQKHKEHLKAKAVAYYHENAEEIKAHKREFHRNNRDKRNRYSREWRRKNRQKAMAYDTSEGKKRRMAKYREKHRQRLRDNARESYRADIVNKRAIQNSYIVNLRDSYVRRRLTRGTLLQPKDIPQSLIDAKRSHLKCLRLIKEQKNG
jgi:hypothetical protein